MLTPFAATNAKGQAKPYKLRNERAMYLVVRPDGGRWWRFDYRRLGTGKRNTISLGTSPDVSPKKSPQRRDDARALLVAGVNPGDQRKAEAGTSAETFEAVARDWFAKDRGTWVPAQAGWIMPRLERDAFPGIGRRPIASVTAPDVPMMQAWADYLDTLRTP